MIKYFLQESKYIKWISITYLIAGHTYMPVDSMHALIEKSIKNQTIWAPSEWPCILTNARVNPKNYVVHKQFSDFMDWKSIAGHKGLIVNNEKLAISTIKQVKFTKNSQFIEWCDQFSEEMVMQTGKFEIRSRSRILLAYSEKLAIASKKFNDIY